MNGDPRSQNFVSLFAILGAFLIVAGLVYAMKYYTRPAPLNQARAAERKQALEQLRAENAKALANYDWQDRAKGIVHLPIDRAMELTVEEYKNPMAARTNLIARAEKASAPPPKVNYE